MAERGVALPHPLVKGGRQRHRADLGAGAAGVALGRVDVAGFPVQGDGEMARLAFQPLDFGLGENLDVRMLGHLDELGGNQTGGTVVGGEGLVQLGHDPADGDVPFHQVHFVARGRRIQAGLHPGDAAAHHHDGAHFVGVGSGFSVFGFRFSALCFHGLCLLAEYQALFQAFRDFL